MKQSKKVAFSGIGITAGLLIALVFAYAVLFYNTSQEKTVNTLEELSNQGVKVIQQEVVKNQMMLENLAILLEQEASGDIEEMIRYLIPVDKANNFKRMGIVREDGTGLATDGSNVDGKADLVRARFAPVFEGHSVVSDRLDDLVDGKAVTIYGAPFKAKDGVTYALFGTYSTDLYEESLSVSTFEGRVL